MKKEGFIWNGIGKIGLITIQIGINNPVVDNYLKNSINPATKTLSIASGNGINELVLISNNFDITCSDLEIPQCYEASKKLFGYFSYLKLNILKETVQTEFDNIYSTSTCYIFSDQNLEKFFINVHKMLKKDGILILDFGGGEDNLTSFFIDIYLVFEAYLIYYLSIGNLLFGFSIFQFPGCWSRDLCNT